MKEDVFFLKGEEILCVPLSIFGIILQFPTEKIVIGKNVPSTVEKTVSNNLNNQK
jgi:hypothetical protein